MDIRLTERAAGQLQEVIIAEELDPRRCYVCAIGDRAGRRLDITEHRTAEDEVSEQLGVRILCDPRTRERLRGTLVDYRSDETVRGFVFSSEPRGADASSDGAGEVEERAYAALREVLDPEVGVNIVDLGLVYNVEARGSEIEVHMTMTTPACPLGDPIERSVPETLGQSFPEMRDTRVELVWDPPWSPKMMSDDAKRMLGWVG